MLKILLFITWINIKKYIENKTIYDAKNLAFCRFNKYKIYIKNSKESHIFK